MVAFCGWCGLDYGAVTALSHRCNDFWHGVGHQLGTINAENLIKAHAMLESQQAHGKIVLEGF